MIISSESIYAIKIIRRISIDEVWEVASISIRYLKFEIIQHEKLNSKSKPCVEDESYIFGDCIRDYFEEEVGCCLPWHENRGNKSVCYTMDQFKKYKKEYTVLMNKESQTIINDYGCYPPCKYKEIREVGDPMDITGGSETTLKNLLLAQHLFLPPSGQRQRNSFVLLKP